MIINMVGGGGGAALNFKVVPGLTQPGTASENTIWVKAEKIASWYFSATQPEGMQEWDVWFPTGTASAAEFNAIKKNAVQVYPMSAKQMVSGALVSVDAMSYKSGKWVEWWRGELYDSGKNFDIVGGGLKIWNNTAGGAAFKEDHISLEVIGESGMDNAVYTEEKITFPVRNYTKLKMDVDITTYGSANSFPFIFGLRTSNEHPARSASNYVYSAQTSKTGAQTMELNIASAKGDYYFYANAIIRDGKITKIWFE